MKYYIFILLVMATNTAKSEPVVIWSQSNQNQYASMQHKPGLSTVVQLDREALSVLSKGKEMQISLPDGSVVALMEKGKYRNRNGSETLLAGSSDTDVALVLTYDREYAYGYIEAYGVVYTLKVIGSEGTIRKAQLDLEHEEVLLEVANSRRSNSRAEKATYSKSSVDYAISSMEKAELKVMVVYTPAAISSVQVDDVETLLNQHVATTNHFLEKSGVLINVALVHAEFVNYEESQFEKKALSELRQGLLPVFSDIKNLRYEHGADVVALMTAQGGGSANVSCGHDGSIEGCAASRYFRAYIGDSTGTIFAHELGHSIGLAHSRSQGEIGHSFPYALGYRSKSLDGNWVGTIMAYAGGIPRFSSPGVLADGSARTGVSREYQNGADASYALNAIRFQAANYYDDDPDLALAADKINLAGNEILADCVRRGYEKYAPIITRLECSGKGLESLEGLQFLTELEYMDISENSIDDLSEFPLLDKLREIDVSDNNITDFSTLLRFPELAVIHLKGNDISNLPDFTTLEDFTDLKDSVSIDISDNSITDIEPLLEILERKSVTVITNLYGNDSIPCWQKQHLVYNHFSYDSTIANGQPVAPGVYEPCDPADDFLDFNGNSVSNIDDIVSGKNPYLEPTENQIGFSEAAFLVQEDAQLAIVSVERKAGSIDKEITFGIATREKVVEDLGGDDTEGEEGGSPFGARAYFDFEPVNQFFTLPAGQDRIDVEISVIDDDYYYGDAHFQVKLYGAGGAIAFGEDTAAVIIVDEEVEKMEIKDESEGLNPPEEADSDDSIANGNSGRGASAGSSGGGAIGAHFVLLLLLVLAGGRRWPVLRVGRTTAS